MGYQGHGDLTELFELRRVGDRDWVIYDRRVPRDDGRCVVAHIFETEDDVVEVVWLDGRALPTLYISAPAVLDDLIYSVQRHGGTRPIEIPAFRPPPVA